MSDDRLEFFVRLETEVWEAMVAGDAETDRRLLSDDFLVVYPRGFEGHDAPVVSPASPARSSVAAWRM